MTAPKGSEFAGAERHRSIAVALLPGAGRLVDLHARELPQKDDLCGAFWATLALRAARPDDPHDWIDQDAVAAAAGTTVAAVPNGSRPPNEPGRRDYRLQLPAAADPERSGTSPAGLMRALSQLSGGEVATVPVSGRWEPSVLRALVAVAQTVPMLAVVANVATGKLWGSRPRLDEVLAHLETGALDGPPPDWSTGHFVAILGTAEGQAGTLAIVADTYPTLGWRGVHLQPLELMSDALHRDGDGFGGVLLVAPVDYADSLAERVVSTGLRVGAWDNGSDDELAPAADAD